MKPSAKEPRAPDALVSKRSASLPVDPLDPTPRQFPMTQFWNRPCGLRLLPALALGCGIHRPQDYSLIERSEHLATCIAKRKLRVLDSGEFGRLHDALDLADRTCRRRPSKKPRPTAKRVRFSLDSAQSVFEEGSMSYTATDAIYGDAPRAADRFAYYCADQSCGCHVGLFFRSENEHDEHVRDRRMVEAGEVSDSTISDGVLSSEDEDEKDMSKPLMLPELKSVAGLKTKRCGDLAPSCLERSTKRRRSS